MSEAARSIATEEGFARFIAIFNAQEVWRTLTKRQREALTSRLQGDVATVTVRALEAKNLVKNGLVTTWGDFVLTCAIPPASRTDHEHRPVQHRDGKPPWCKVCGLTADFTTPVSRFAAASSPTEPEQENTP